MIKILILCFVITECPIPQRIERTLITSLVRGNLTIASITLAIRRPHVAAEGGHVRPPEETLRAFNRGPFA